MNPIVSQLLKMFGPMLESQGLAEWQSVGLPKCQALANALAKESGQEEALIAVDALDKIMQFEFSRPIP